MGDRKEESDDMVMIKAIPVFPVFIIVTIPLLFGAVQPSVWSIYAGMIICAFIIALWRNAVDFCFTGNPLFLLSVGIFFAYTVFQIMPVAPPLLKIFSAVRFDGLSKAAVLLDNQDFRASISYVPAVSFSWWTFLISLVLFFSLLNRYLVDTRNLVWITGAMLIIAIFQSIYGLLQALIPAMGVLWVDYVPSYLGDARGTFINRNHFAGFIEMVWPLGLGVIFGLAHRWQENMQGGNSRKKLKNLMASDRVGLLLFFVIALLFILLALLFSKSRAGITGAFIGFAAFMSLACLGGKKFSTAALIFIGLGFCFILFYGNVIGFEELIGRFLATDSDSGSRVNIWMDTIAIIKDHPFGIGLRNYETVMPIYNSTAPPGIKFAHAHNDYLQLLTEAGWPGFIALVGGFYVFIGRSIWRIHKFGSSMDTPRFYIGIGALCGLISIAFHSFFDFNLQIPANLLYFVVLMAIADAGVGGKTNDCRVK